MHANVARVAVSAGIYRDGRVRLTRLNVVAPVREWHYDWLAVDMVEIGRVSLGRIDENREVELGHLYFRRTALPSCRLRCHVMY